MKCSSIKTKIALAIGATALLFTLYRADKNYERAINPIAWADITKDGTPDAIITRGFPLPNGNLEGRLNPLLYNEGLVAVDGKTLNQDKDGNWTSKDRYDVVLGAFGDFEFVEGTVINPERRTNLGTRIQPKGYLSLNARGLASEDGKIQSVKFNETPRETLGNTLDVVIETTSRMGLECPNRYVLKDVRPLVKMDYTGNVKPVEE